MVTETKTVGLKQVGDYATVEGKHVVRTFKGDVEVKDEKSALALQSEIREIVAIRSDARLFARAYEGGSGNTDAKRGLTILQWMVNDALKARKLKPAEIDTPTIVDTCVDVSDSDFEAAIRSARGLRDGIKRSFMTKYQSPLPGGKTPRELSHAMSNLVKVASAAATQAAAAGVLAAHI
jgi:hypothetical protein